MSASRSYPVGSRPVITASFTDVAGVAADPTVVTFMIRDADGAVTSTSSPNAAITNTSVGTWVYTFPSALPNTPGMWYVRVEGTGVVAAKEQAFVVDRSAFPEP